MTDLKGRPIGRLAKALVRPSASRFEHLAPAVEQERSPIEQVSPLVEQSALRGVELFDDLSRSNVEDRTLLAEPMRRGILGMSRGIEPYGTCMRAP